MKILNITQFEPLKYAAKEAFNTLATNVSFAGNHIRKIMITSCQPDEGKSFVAMNLMRTFAETGKNVVLVDADLRRSRLAARYGISSSAPAMGLSHFLAGMCSLEDILYETDIEGAYMILAGKDVVNSLPLLSTPNLEQLFDILGRSFDYVLVDAPPIGVIVDAAEIAKYCDGTLIVVKNSHISRQELVEATQMIQRTGCMILGAALNQVSIDSHNAKKYYNRMYYSNYQEHSDKPSGLPQRAARKGR